MMDEHRSLSLADQVFERLENDILSGKYPIGTVLTISAAGSEGSDSCVIT